MKRILTTVLILFSLSSFAQTWVKWNGQLYLKQGNDSTGFGEDYYSTIPGIVEAINAKQPPLVSGNNIKTLNGQPILGSGDITLGYTLSVQALTSSPPDATTTYFGQLPKAPVTAAATSKIFIRKAGTIKIAQIYCYSGTAGTAEAWPISIRLNNTTDTQIASLSVSASERVFTNSNLNIAVVAGDYIEIKSVNPTWVTNPLTCVFGGYIYIE